MAVGDEPLSTAAPMADRRIFAGVVALAAVAIVICLTTLVYTTLKSWKLATQTVSELLVDTGDARATRFGEIPHAQLLFNESARRVALIGAEAPAGLDIRRNLMWSQLAQPLANGRRVHLQRPASKSGDGLTALIHFYGYC